MLRSFERRILRAIYVPVNNDSMGRTRYDGEIYMFYNELDKVRVTKLGRLRWLGHLFRMQEVHPFRKLKLRKPEGNRRVGNPRLRWLVSVEELENMGIRI
jgi:hypothetical protein